MKKILLFSALMALLMSPQLAKAQASDEGDAGLSREERKEWKRIAKDYKRNLTGLKQLTEEHEFFKVDNARLKEENERIKGMLRTQQRENTELTSNVSRLEQELRAARESLAKAPELMVDGVVFKVQIGAFKKRELSEDLDTSVNFDIEKTDGLNKYVVGQFREYNKADELKKQLRAMGVGDAWVVPYRDGIRVPLKEVLDALSFNTH